MTDWKPKGELRYPDYLRIPELLRLQRPVSDPPHHDETLFIIVHQAFELWFKLVLHSVDELGRRLEAGDVQTALKLARRAATIQRSITDQIAILETMSALDFLEFRTELEGASGFQSAQFRELEATLGLADRERVPVALEGAGSGRAAYYGPLLPAERERIERRLARPSIEELFLDLVARTVTPLEPGRVFLSDLPDLLEGRPEAARSALPALEAAAEVSHDPTARALLARLELLPLWAKLPAAERAEVGRAARRARAASALDGLRRLEAGAPEAHDLRLLDEEMARRATLPADAVASALAAAGMTPEEASHIGQRLLRRAGLREVYRRGAHRAGDGSVHDLWLLAEALLDQAQSLALYRFRHLQMVERMIGKRRGTGGSPGAAYLEKTLAYRSFPEILRVRTFL